MSDITTDSATWEARDEIETPIDMDLLSVNTIRTLAMDAVQQANSGHPGTPMALAPVVYCLWQRILRFDPDKAVNPKYETLGHGSVTLDDIRQFRQLDSRCPGHPERGRQAADRSREVKPCASR